MTKKLTDVRKEILNIKQDLNTGVLSYEEAKVKAQPFIDMLNVEGAKVAKKFGKKHYNFNFVGLMR